MKSLKNNQGIALFLVLWVLALLSVIVGEFCYATRTEVNITRNFKEQTEAYYIALAGLNRAVEELTRKRLTRTPQSVLPLGEEEEEPEPSPWRVNAHIPEVSFGAGQFAVRIENESGKIDINTANDALLRMMLKGFEMDEMEKNIIVDSILDWRDEDSFHRLHGAENDYYQSLPEPYDCKDGPFDTVEELLLVRGVTPEIFYGGLKEMVTVFQGGGPRIQEGTGEIMRRGRGPQPTGGGFAGSQRININAASEKMLLSLPLMTPERVQEILDFRQIEDFISITQLSAVIGPEVVNGISQWISLEESPHYTIRSVGMVREGRIRQGIEAFVQIEPGRETAYSVIEWRDLLGDPMEYAQAMEAELFEGIQ